MGRDQRNWYNQIKVERGFRWRQARLVLVLVLFSVISSTVALGFFYDNLLDQFTGGDLPLYFAPEEMELLSSRIPGIRETVFKWFLVLAGLNGMVTLLAVMVVTHKLGGPLYRLKQDLARIGQGDLTVNVTLRKGDEFQELAESLNDTVARLQVMIMGIRDNVKAIRNIELEGKQQAQLEVHLRSIEDQVGYFKLTDIPR